MDAGTRIRAVKMIEKMEKNVAYSQKLGIRNISSFSCCGKVKKS